MNSSAGNCKTVASEKMRQMRRSLLASIVWILGSISFTVQGFLPPYRSTNRPAHVLCSKSNQFTYYSRNFQRHVVCENKRNTTSVLASFQWLDEAKSQYPNAVVLACHQSRSNILAGVGVEEESGYNATGNSEEFLMKIKSNHRTSVLGKYESLITSLTKQLGAPFLNHFPESDHYWVQERILFLLSPIPKPLPNDTDWPLRLSEGYGVGFSESQAASAILALRHLLSIDPVGTASLRPPVPYFYQQLKVQFRLVDQARGELAYWLIGACPEDTATFAYLKSIDATWDQCRIILEAFSQSLVSCDMDPSWELYESGPVRGALSEEAIDYLRKRLQLSPSEVFAMIKTHSRLSSYSLKTIKTHLDAIQSKLLLTSEEVRRIVLRTPSVLGVSVLKIDQRITFLSDEVYFSSFQIQKSVLQFPSLLQYSIEANLRPKIRFLKNEVGIAPTDLTKMVAANPTLLGSSFKKTIEPTVYGLQEVCGLSLEEISGMLVQVPQLLSLNWETNLQPKLLFLKSRLELTDYSLRVLLTAMPRLLVHSVSNSLEPKLRMLEEAARGSEVATKVVIENPSLLLTNRASLEQRLAMFEVSNATFTETFRPQRGAANGKGKVRHPRRKRKVLVISNGTVFQALPDVSTAATTIGTSTANMYNIIKTGRIYKGKSYAYGSRDEHLVQFKETAATGTTTEDQTISTYCKSTKGERRQGFLQDLKRNFVPDECKVRLVEVLRNDTVEARATNRTYLAAFVSGRTFPPEKASEVRGRRKSGGLAMYFPQLSGCHVGGELLRTAAEKCFANQIMPNTENGTSYIDGLVLLGYPYLKPSRNRCGLYVCRDALRVIFALLELEESCPDLPTSIVDIDIFTDSNYVWSLVQNSTSLLRWGSYSRKDEFEYDGSMSEWKANPDILYPLARTYYRLVTQRMLPLNANQPPKKVAKELRIRFRHESVEAWIWKDSKGKKTSLLAERAAAWQYERAQQSLL